MDAMLEEEMIDLLTFLLQNPGSKENELKKNRVSEIGKELYLDGGIDTLENMFFVVQNRIKEEIGKDPEPFRTLWNENTEEWNH